MHNQLSEPLTVTVARGEVIAQIRTNRDRHRQIFEEAVENYRTAVLQELEDRITSVKNNKPIDKFIRLPEPEDHTKDYDRVLDMLSWHQGDTIELSEADFARYVRDEWDWKQQWIGSTLSYTAAAAG